LVTAFVAGQWGRLELEFLPAYAPELNPVEYLWGYWKHHQLPNFCPKNFSELSYQAHKGLAAHVTSPNPGNCLLETGPALLM
jgi:transposase